jgi:hypothetical protein
MIKINEVNIKWKIPQHMDLLCNLPIFESLTEEEIHYLQKNSTEVNYKQKQVIVKIGEDYIGAIFISHGAV